MSTTITTAPNATNKSHTIPLQDTEEESDEECLFWVKDFIEKQGHTFFCRVDADFILDRFNLTGLSTLVANAQAGYDNLIKDDDSSDSGFDSVDEAETSPVVELATVLLYCLLHQRFIITPYGMSLMKRKYLRGDFGRCPRYACDGQHVLPTALSDLPRKSSVKLFCPRCRDIYQPRSNHHQSIDGAFFGTSFAHVFLMHYKMDYRPVAWDLHRHPDISVTASELKLVAQELEAKVDSEESKSDISEDDFEQE